MWIFLSVGFFSIVAHNARPDLVLVRARVKADLVRLRSRHGFLKGRAIHETLFADYPFRMFLPRTDLARVLRVEARLLAATNFKSAIAKTDPKRAAIYSRTWGVLQGLEDLNGDDMIPRHEAQPPRTAAAVYSHAEIDALFPDALFGEVRG
jgi:hypothetical protein